MQTEAESIRKCELTETISNIKKAIQIFDFTAADVCESLIEL